MGFELGGLAPPLDWPDLATRVQQLEASLADLPKLVEAIERKPSGESAA